MIIIIINDNNKDKNYDNNYDNSNLLSILKIYPSKSARRCFTEYGFCSAHFTKE